MTTDVTSRKAPLRFVRIPFLLNILIAALLAAICWSRMGTLATGEDPATYIRIAQRLLDSGFGHDALLSLFNFIAPLFPLWTALVLAIAGPAGVYLLQPIVWVVVMALMARWAVEYAREERPGSECWMGIVCPALLLGSYGLNAHFMLLPFRETMALGVTVLALRMWRRATIRASFGYGLLAGAILLMAMGIREPMPLALAAPVLVTGLRILFRKESARPLGGLLALPLLLCGLVLGLYAAGLWTPNFQIRLWWDSLTGGAPSARYGARLAVTASWVVSSLGVAGIFGLVWSLGRRWRDPLFWGSFGFTALLFLLFHAGYTPHRRYFLMTLFFLAPMAAWGLFDALQTLLRLIRSPVGARRTSAVVWAVVVVWAGWIVFHVQPWGARVGWADLRALQHTMHGVPGKFVVVDETVRMAREALMNYTAKTLVSLPQAACELEKGNAVWYLRPLNEAAAHSQKTWEADPRATGLYYGDVPAQQHPLPLSLDTAQFELIEWRPRTQRQVSKHLALQNPAKLLWFDFGYRAVSSSPVHVSIACADRPLWFGDMPATGWQPVALPPYEGADSGTLDIRMDDPEGRLPDSLSLHVPDAGRSQRFSMTARRSLSTDEWVDSLASPRPESKWAAAFDQDLVLKIPAPQGAPVQTWKCVLFLARRSPANPTTADTAIEVSSPWLDEPLKVSWPGRKSTLVAAVSGQVPAGGARELSLRIRAAQPANMALTEIRVGYDGTADGGSPSTE